MASIVVLLTVTVFNIVMWIIMGVKFKRIFSTEQIIEETRDTLNHLLIEINRNAERNVTLIDDRIKQLKAVSAEAERKVLLLKGELDKAEKSRAFVEKVQSLGINDNNAASQSSKPKASQSAGKNSSSAEKTPASSSSRKRTSRAKTPVQSYIDEQAQGTLFNSEGRNDSAIKASSHADESSESPENESSGKIPFIEPQVYFSENPVQVKKDFNTQVRELYEAGNNEEEIAAITGRSTQEVKFSLEFS